MTIFRPPGWCPAEPARSDSKAVSNVYLSAAAASAMRRGEMEDALARIEAALEKAAPLAKSNMQLPSSAVPEPRAAAPAAVHSSMTRAVQREPLPGHQRKPELVSNGAAPARLFYTAPEAAGVGLANRRDRAVATSGAVSLEEEAALRHHGVQLLTDVNVASLLGPLADYLPSSAAPWREAKARKHFDGLLARVQQAHLRGAVEAELRAAAPDAVWCRDNRVFMQTETASVGVVGRPMLADMEAWTAFVRGPEAPSMEPGATFVVPA